QDGIRGFHVTGVQTCALPISLLISDIEMPEMDGYTLTAEIKADPLLRNMHVVLHSSLSGVFNEAMVKKVGADQFIAKFHPDELEIGRASCRQAVYIVVAVMAE